MVLTESITWPLLILCMILLWMGASHWTAFCLSFSSPALWRAILAVTLYRASHIRGGFNVSNRFNNGITPPDLPKRNTKEGHLLI